MIKGTFCDWLMMQGVQFHPDTKIIKNDLLTNVTSNSLQEYVDVLRVNLTPTIPLFNYTLIECESSDPSLSSGKTMEFGYEVRLTNSKPDESDSNGIKEYYELYEGCKFYTITSHRAIRDFGRLIKSDTIILWAVRGSWFVNNAMFIKNNFNFEQEDDFTHDDLCLAITNAVSETFMFFHTSQEIELVDYSDIHKRIITRREGKEPSPYFRIINPEATQKRYEDDRPSHKSGIKMPFHIRRGHFRRVENHPIAHFNKTSFIEATTVGNKAQGTIKKGYTIRLSETNK